MAGLGPAVAGAAPSRDTALAPSGRLPVARRLSVRAAPGPRPFPVLAGLPDPHGASSQAPAQKAPPQRENGRVRLVPREGTHLGRSGSPARGSPEHGCRGTQPRPGRVPTRGSVLGVAAPPKACLAGGPGPVSGGRPASAGPLRDGASSRAAAG